MPKFAYKGILESGKRVAGVVSCADRREVVRQLLGRSCHPISVDSLELARTDVRRFTRRLFHKVRVTSLSVFARQLASLLKAGIPVVEALKVLQGQSQSRVLRQTLLDIEERISRQAGTLAEAMSEHPRVFDPVFCGLVRAGEQSGDLANILDSLAEHLAKSARVRGQVLGAFIYPVFIFILGAAAVFVLMAFVIPRFMEMFESFGQSLPWPTKIVIAVSSFLGTWWWLVLAGVGMLVTACMLLLRKEAVKKECHRVLLRSPILGPVFLKLEVARISKTFGALLANGVRILEALRITGESTRNLAIRAAFPAMAKDVRAGETLATAAEKTKLFPGMMLNLIRTGESTSQLPDMLSELARIYEEEAERAVAGAVKLLEPLLILIVGGVITGIVAAVMLPIFEASAMIQ